MDNEFREISTDVLTLNLICLKVDKEFRESSADVSTSKLICFKVDNEFRETSADVLTLDQICFKVDHEFKETSAVLTLNLIYFKVGETSLVLFSSVFKIIVVGWNIVTAS